MSPDEVLFGNPAWKNPRAFFSPKPQRDPWGALVENSCRTWVWRHALRSCFHWCHRRSVEAFRSMVRGHVVTDLTLVYVGVGLLQFPQHPGRKGWRFSNHDVSRFWKEPVISYSKTMVDHSEGFPPGHFREFVGWWNMITRPDDCMILQVFI